MRQLILYTFLLLGSAMISCHRDDDLPAPTASGVVTYTINGISYRFEDLGNDCTVAATFNDGELTGINISAGAISDGSNNAISISDYISNSSGTYAISNEEAEAQSYIITCTVDNVPYSIFWGEGLGTTTGAGSITYTEFSPSEAAGSSHLEGTFSFTLYNLSNEPLEVEGSFHF